MNSKKVLFGVVAGIAAGALLGILFAPENGKKIRKKIGKMGEDFADGLKDKFGHFVDGLIDKIEETEDDVSNIARKGKEKIEKLEDVSLQNGN